MKILYSWLKEYCDVTLAPDKLAETLTMAGLSVESVTPYGSDHVLEIEITANRPDWLSVIGVAREVAALTGAALKLPKCTGVKPSTEKEGVSVKIEDKALCARYTGRVIHNVKIAASPAWLQARLEAMGLKPVNNIVDITNFCLFELGEPMHAFDLDKLARHSAVVRKARKGEKIVMIDGSEKILDETMLVIADSEKPVAVAGVMGGLDTEVTAGTKNIFLEAAYFDPVSVRRTSRKLGISTESSYRFERRVDLENIVHASDRALGLILEIAGGQAGECIDVGVKTEKRRTVGLRYERLTKLLGIGIAPDKIKKIIESLGMTVASSDKEGLQLEIPGFRHDLKAEVDIIEEVARVYGYNNIPSTVPMLVEQPVRRDPGLVACNKIMQVLTGLGLDEVITYSLLSKRLIAAAALPAEDAIDIKNPLTSEQESMRTSLVPGMLGALVWNINRKSKDLKFFELSNVYLKKPGDEYAQRKSLCIGIAGQAFSSWTGAARDAGFFELKGIIETLLSELGITGVSFRYARRPFLAPAQCAELLIGDTVAGAFGEVSRKALAGFDIREKAYILEADADVIIRHVMLEKSFRDLPKYPAISRDISLLAGKENSNDAIMAVIRKAAGGILKEAHLIDRYTGKQIPEGKVSLTYRLEYQDPARTLQEKDVAEAHTRVLQELDEKFGAKLR